MAGSNAGRSAKLNSETIELICNAIAIGATQRIACGYAQVSEVTFYGWLKISDEAQAKLDDDSTAILTNREKLALKLTKSIRTAKAQAGIGWLQVVDKAAKTDPAWAMKMLEKTFPEDYAVAVQKQKVEVTGADGGSLSIKVEYANFNPYPTETA